MATEEPKQRRRDVGDGGISWDKTSKLWIGTVLLGFCMPSRSDKSG
jgi:hypothetical protein